MLWSFQSLRVSSKCAARYDTAMRLCFHKLEMLPSYLFQLLSLTFFAYTDFGETGCECLDVSLGLVAHPKYNSI